MAASVQFSQKAVRGISSAHRVWRWGNTGGGTVSHIEGEISKTPTLIDNANNVSAIAAGKNHSAFVSMGKVYTYGHSKYGQLGWKTDQTSAKEPGLVDTLDDISQIALGEFHTAAVDCDGNLFTWGWGGSFFSGAGALGLGDKNQRNEPEHVAGSLQEPIKQVCAGSRHTVVLTESGRVYSTGQGEYGILGHGDNSDLTEFQEIEYFSEYRDSILNEQALGKETRQIITKIGCGQHYSAALTTDGELYVWGRNDQCQLGQGEDSSGDMWSAERYPRLIRSLAQEKHRVVDFSCGDYHMDCLSENGQLWSWGNRNWLAPHPISLPRQYENGIQENIIKIVGGNKFSLALTECGYIYAWGKKSSGCIPNDEIRPKKLEPALFGNQKVLDISVKDSRCIAITNESTLIDDLPDSSSESDTATGYS